MNCKIARDRIEIEKQEDNKKNGIWIHDDDIILQLWQQKQKLFMKFSFHIPIFIFVISTIKAELYKSNVNWTVHGICEANG